MFYGYVSLQGGISVEEKKGIAHEDIAGLKHGYFWFDRANCISKFQLIGIVNRDKSIKIKNPMGNNFPSDFLSIDELISYVKTQEYYFKLSIILYNDSDKEVLLYRDLFGISPLYYIYVPDTLIAFSSSLSSLVNNPSLDPYLQPNSVRISQYLTWLFDGNVYDSSTFFSHFHNVLPGNKLTLAPNKKDSHTFIEFTFPQWQSQPKIEEIGEEFKLRFKQSINRNLKQSGLIGAQLSGGLDSSSICSMIRNLEPDIPLHTIYADTDTVQTNEKSYAIEVSNDINSIHHVIQPKNNSFECANLHISLYGQPEYMHNSPSVNQSIMQEAISYGCTSLFNGDPGDAIVGYGSDYLSQLFDDGNWALIKKMISDSSSQMKFLNSDVQNQSYKIIYSLLARKKRTLSGLKMLQLIFQVSQFFDIPLSYFYASGKRKVKDHFRIPKSIQCENQNFHIAPLVNNIEYSTISNADSVADPDSFYDVFTTQFILMSEEFYILDYHYGILHQFPFYDKSLFELCMTVPLELKYDNGRKRGHFREAMKGILTETVRTRTSKANFGLYGRKVIIELYYDSLDLLSTDNDVWQYVDKKKFNHSIKLLLDDSLELYIYNRVIFFTSRTIYLAIWFDMLKNKSFKSFFEHVP